MGLEPLFGLFICIAILFFLCILTCVIYIFVRVFKAQKRMDRKWDDTFRRL